MPQGDERQERQRRYSREYARRYRASLSAEKRAEISAKKKAYNAAHREERRAYRQKYEQTHSQKRRKYETNRKLTLKYKYNLTVEQVEFLTAVNGERCWVCNSPSSHILCIDRATETPPVIRGVLCTRCKVILGLAKNDPARLQNLADYLARHVDDKYLLALSSISSANKE